MMEWVEPLARLVRLSFSLAGYVSILQISFALKMMGNLTLQHRVFRAHMGSTFETSHPILPIHSRHVLRNFNRSFDVPTNINMPRGTDKLLFHWLRSILWVISCFGKRKKYSFDCYIEFSV